MIQHKELAAGRWAQMSVCEQMANIGGEVSRALNWQKKGNQGYARKAVERALELFDLSLDAPMRFPARKEFARLREAVVDYFLCSNQFSSSENIWRSYFGQFAYAVRRQP